MKSKIQDIISAVDFDSDMSESYLNLKTGEVCMYTDEEISAAENNDDLSDSYEWYRDAVEKAKQFVENPDNYLSLPSKYDFNEYHIMEEFIDKISVSEQSEMMYQAIKGKGAFHRFKVILERFALTNEWYKFKDKKLYEFVELWCKENNINYE